MSIAATLALVFWPLVVAVLLQIMPVGRGALAAYVLGWLFLPLIELDIPGLPSYGKFTATGLALLVLLPIFAGRELASLRFRWFDLPIAAWCVCPFVSALSNGLGVYDGAASIFKQVVLYAVPYVAGRLFLQRPDEWRTLSRLLVVGGLVYVPLSIWELRMSPQIHRLLYGVTARDNWELKTAIPWCYYAPTVFMNSAFELVTMYVGVALLSYWAWRTAANRLCRSLPNVALFVIFSLMVVLSQKMTGVALMLIGIATFLLVEKTQFKWFAATLVIIPAVYMAVFVLGALQGDLMTDTVRSVASERRARSLQARLDNDAILLNKAMQRPIFGWGGWGRNRVYDERGRDVAVTDTMWMITFGTKGTVGLLAESALYALPIIFFIIVFPYSQWTNGMASLLVPFVVILGLQLYDHLFNAFPNAMYPMIAGGVVQSTYVAQAANRTCVAQFGPRPARAPTKNQGRVHDSQTP